MEEPPVLPQDVSESLAHQGEDAAYLVRMRLDVCAQLEQAAVEMDGERQEWSNSLHADVHSVIGHLHGPLLDKMLSRSKHKDSRYFPSLCEGRPALGRIESAGLYRKVKRPARIELQTWLAGAPKRNREIIASVKSSGDPELDAAA